MRLLVVNPNTSASVTGLIAAEARRAASPGTEIDAVTAAFGMAYIETRLESVIGGYAAVCAAAEHYERHDGVIVAAFGDPGLGGMRELFDVPVTGMTEAALASACLLGQRFSIVAISRRIKAWYRECVQGYGLETRLASIRSLEQPLANIATVQDDHAERLVALCEQTVVEDGADVVIIAGAPLAGLARSVRGRIPVPVVDGVSSAVRHLESLVALDPGAAQTGSFARPPAKPNQGLPPRLAAMLAAGRP
ncbi:Asp/Glu/hydantoin racemase [Verticiella sediminum]|uniref:Asp/Glu/hydantoin racemase n=1 Tax=Verticiella sediminum TaxID=1247510 RepID=A0A556AQ64_9BURK|nr:aspartate/glutamate racemase family protein [Verticiella sediminum]TSH95049.1 Asp/Glu/hydantoin racemase [Verticiella sediminum]